MASLIKTNKISTPGGEEFTLPTTLPSSASNLTSTSGGQLGYGALGFSSDRLETTTGKISRVFVDKVRCNNASSTLSNFTLDCVPSGVTDLDTIQTVYFNVSGVCATGTFYPAIQILDSSNNNLIDNSNSGQMRWRLNSRGAGLSTQTGNTSNASWGYHKLTEDSYPPTGASATGEIFTKTTPADWNDRARFSGEMRITQISSNLGTFASSGSGMTSGGRIMIEARMGYRRGSVSSTSTGSFVSVYTASLWLRTSQAPMAKIKLYDYNGSASFNEGLCWTETTLNSLKT
tara:strand:- start:9924 stop:10790 length:867 start_codon:yes stop_codon:yes gene_type:complete